MKRLICALFAMMLLLTLGPGTAALAEEGEELVVNGDFSELDSAGMPRNWRRAMWFTDEGVSRLYVDEAGYDGNSVAVVNADANDARFVQSIDVEPDSVYRFSCMVRAEGCGSSGYGATLSFENTFSYSESVLDTAGEWRELTVYGRSGSKQTEVVLMLRVGGYSSINTGRAWFDNVSCVRVDEGDVPAGAQILTLEPVSSSNDDNSASATVTLDAPERNTEAYLLMIALYGALILAVARRSKRIGEARVKAGTLLVVGLALAFALRVALAMCVRGYNTDINCFSAWSERMFELGPTRFYAEDYFCDYPPGYMLLLWLPAALRHLLGLGLQSPGHLLLLKLFPIAFDLLAAGLLWSVARRRGMSEKLAAALALVYAFNPAVFIDSAAWGQIDSIFTLLIALCVLEAVGEKYVPSLLAFAAAMLVKPQAMLFGPLGLATLGIYLLRGRDGRKLRSFLLGVASALGLLYLTAFLMNFGRAEGALDALTRPVTWLVQLYGGTLNSYKYLTINALNLYALLDLNWVAPEGHMSWMVFAWCMFGASYLYSFFLCAKSRERRALILSGAVLIALIFAFGPMIHERYIFPALLLLALAYACYRDRRLLFVLTVMTMTAAMNELLVLQGGMTEANYGHLQSSEQWLNALLAAINVANTLYLCWVALDVCAFEHAVPLGARDERLFERLQDEAEPGAHEVPEPRERGQAPSSALADEEAGEQRGHMNAKQASTDESAGRRSGYGWVILGAALGLIVPALLVLALGKGTPARALNFYGLGVGTAVTTICGCALALGIAGAVFLLVRCREPRKAALVAAALAALAFAFGPLPWGWFIWVALALLGLACALTRDRRLLFALLPLSALALLQTLATSELAASPAAVAIAIVNAIAALFVGWVAWDACVRGHFAPLGLDAFACNSKAEYSASEAFESENIASAAQINSHKDSPMAAPLDEPAEAEAGSSAVPSEKKARSRKGSQKSAPLDEATELGATEAEAATTVERAEESAKQPRVGARASGRGHRMNLRARDWLLMAAVTLIYAVVAFVNLGATRAPQTSWVSSQSGESIVFDLGRVQTFRMTYYGGICNSTFTVELSNDGEVWTQPYRAEYEDGAIFRWLRYVPRDDSNQPVYGANLEPDDGSARVTFPARGADEYPRQTARYVRISALSAGLRLSEVVFLDENDAPLPVIVASREGALDDFAVDPALLIDEQDTAPAMPSYYYGTYFDEIYHARTAYELKEGNLTVYEWTHPPLGKVMMSWGIRLFGMTPFGWRFMGALVGVLMVPLMYLLAKQLTKSTKLSFVAMCLMALDAMHFTQTRIATIDSYAVFWIMLMYLFMIRYVQMDWREVSLGRSFVTLGLCGVTMGVAWATKWIGLYASAGLAVLYFWKLASEIIHAGERRLDYCLRALWSCLFCLGFFVAIPALIYYLSYTPQLRVEGVTSVLDMFTKERFDRVVQLQESMFSYHAGLGGDTHYYRSPWYQWPVIWWPMWYFSGTDYLPSGMISSISCMGNPAVWWTGLAALIFVLLGSAWKKRAPREWLIVLIGFASQFLPWVLVPRSTFIYHYFASIPFIILCTALMLGWLRGKSEAGFRLTAVALLVSALVLFIIFYPLESGMPVSRAYAMNLRWLKWYNF